MGRLKGYIWRYWRRYLLGAFCLFGTATLVMIIPWWIRAAVRSIEQGGTMEDITFYAVMIVAAALAQGIIRTFSRFLIFNAGRDIEYDLRNDLFAHLESLPSSFYQSRRTGDLMSRIINDISAIRMLLGPGILNLVNAPLYYVYATVLMFSMDVKLTLAALLPYPILVWTVRKFRGKILRCSLRVQEQMATLSNQVHENLSGMHVVKAYAQEGNQIRQFAGLNDEYQARSLELARLRGLLSPLMLGISGATLLIVIWYGGAQVIRRELMVADLVAFIAYLNILAWPTAAFGWMLSLVERGRAAMERLEEIFKSRPEIVSPPGPPSFGEFRDSIEFRHVWFAYDARRNGRPILRDIHLRLERGRTLGIVGRTGAGKTSLVQLLPRLFDPSSGGIYLDGRDIRTFSLTELRNLIGYVPQDPFLFSTTLRRNLKFGREEVSDEKVERAILVAQLDRDLELFPSGLDTLVGERGVTLSGGQKQRATIARVLALDRPILVLDDCLSSVDAETEEKILKGMRDLLRQKTCLVVSHRISAVKDADEILVLENGEMIERGNHQTLLSRGGTYAELYRQQQLSEELNQV